MLHLTLYVLFKCIHNKFIFTLHSVIVIVSGVLALILYNVYCLIDRMLERMDLVELIIYIMHASDQCMCMLMQFIMLLRGRPFICHLNIRIDGPGHSLVVGAP